MVRTFPKGTEALNLGAPTLLAYLSSFVGLVAPNLEHLRPLGGAGLTAVNFACSSS